MSNQGLHENDGPVFLAVSLGVPFVAVSFGVSLWFYTGRVGLHRGYGSTLGVWVYTEVMVLHSVCGSTQRVLPGIPEASYKSAQTFKNGARP